MDNVRGHFRHTGRLLPDKELGIGQRRLFSLHSGFNIGLRHPRLTSFLGSFAGHSVLHNGPNVISGGFSRTLRRLGGSTIRCGGERGGWGTYSTDVLVSKVVAKYTRVKKDVAIF